MNRATLTILLLIAIATLAGTVVAQRKLTGVKKRVKPPQFSQSQTRRTFFENIFADGLVGERPSDLNASRAPVAPDTAGPHDSATAGGVYAWRNIVSSEALEDEVKARKISVDKNITTPNRFAGGGYRQIRNDFSILAMAFAIIAEYDADVRWKEDAPAIRDAFARSAANSKVGSQQSFNEAKLRKQDLQDLLAGGGIAASGQPDRKASWDLIVDRVPLMARLEIAIQENLQPFIANEKDFKANQDAIVHEANMVAAIGEILTQEGMEESEEDDYNEHARLMKQASRDVLSAIDLGSYDNAVKAVGSINKACSNCHADWR